MVSCHLVNYHFARRHYLLELIFLLYWKIIQYFDDLLLYCFRLKGKLEEQKPERVKPFMTGAAEQIKHILANFNNYQFFIGENMNPDGMVALLDYREDGVSPFMIFFKDGLEMEKY